MSLLQPILKKYPRTRHLEGSRFQHGDHDLEGRPQRLAEVTNLLGPSLFKTRGARAWSRRRPPRACPRPRTG